MFGTGKNIEPGRQRRQAALVSRETHRSTIVENLLLALDTVGYATFALRDRPDAGRASAVNG